MVYLIIVLVSFIHIYFTIRIGYTSKTSDKKRLEKLLPRVFYSSILAAILTSILWIIAPISFAHKKVWMFKIVLIFIPAFFFIGVICTLSGVFFKKVLKA